MKRAIKTIWSVITLFIDPGQYIRNLSEQEREEIGIKLN